MTDKIVVLSTASSVEEAESIARTLVSTKLAACVNILPGAKSIYRWKGEIEEAAEILLVIKTRRELFAALQIELKRVHSYENPEIIAIPIVAGNEAYLDWIHHETT